MALITAAEARTMIPELSTSSTDEDTLIDTLIARVGALLAAWCGYPPASAGGTPTLESASYTEYLDGPGGRELRLPIYPVTAVASIYDDTAWTWGSDALVASTDYAISDGRVGLVLLKETSTHGSWSAARRSLKVAFTAGYATVPADIKAACAHAVRQVWNFRTEQGRANVSGGVVSLSLREEEIVNRIARELLSARRLGSAWL